MGKGREGKHLGEEPEERGGEPDQNDAEEFIYPAMCFGQQSFCGCRLLLPQTRLT